MEANILYWVQVADRMDSLSNMMGFLLAFYLLNLPSRITLVRVHLGGMAALLLLASTSYDWAMALIALAILLDAVDGWMARRFRQESKAGSDLDRHADYYIAGVMWMTLAAIGIVSPLVPAITIARDCWVAMNPARAGKFRWLSSSRMMRAAYGALKLASWELAIWRPESLLANILVWATVGICLLRALPNFLGKNNNSL